MFRTDRIWILHEQVIILFLVFTSRAGKSLSRMRLESAPRKYLQVAKFGKYVKEILA